MAGRGSFIESFPLFGYDLEDYDELFAEKLDLLLQLRDSVRVTWQGRHRAALVDQPVHPRPVQDPLPVWVAVGGNPQSVVRAGALGLPLALAIIGGEPARFAPLAELHRRALAQYGHGPQPVSINGHGFVADTSQAAADSFFGTYAEVMTQLGRERGWGPMTRAQFDALTGLDGALAVGARSRSRRRSSSSTRSSGTTATSCSPRWGRPRTGRCCARSSCSGPRSPRSSARRSRAAGPARTDLRPRRAYPCWPGCSTAIEQGGRS